MSYNTYCGYITNCGNKGADEGDNGERTFKFYSVLAPLIYSPVWFICCIILQALSKVNVSTILTKSSRSLHLLLAVTRQKRERHRQNAKISLSDVRA